MAEYFFGWLYDRRLRKISYTIRRHLAVFLCIKLNIFSSTYSEEVLSEVGTAEMDTSAVLNQSRSSRSKNRLSDSTGLLQVSDHPRMRHNSADDAENK